MSKVKKSLKSVDSDPAFADAAEAANQNIDTDASVYVIIIQKKKKKKKKKKRIVRGVPLNLNLHIVFSLLFLGKDI
jgi:hypothetical protein